MYQEVQLLIAVPQSIIHVHLTPPQKHMKHCKLSGQGHCHFVNMKVHVTL